MRSDGPKMGDTVAFACEPHLSRLFGGFHVLCGNVKKNTHTHAHTHIHAHTHTHTHMHTHAHTHTHTHTK